MAKELVNLCPENIVFSENVKIGKSLEYALGRQLPLSVGATYVVPRQVNHAQRFTINNRVVNSCRLFVGEILNGELVAIRTISVADFKAEYYVGETMPEVPAMTGKNGGWTTDREHAPKKTMAAPEMEIALIEGRAQIMRPIVVQYNGKVEGWTENFIDMGDKKALAVKDGKLELTPRFYNTWSVLKGAEIPDNLKDKFIAGMSKCEPYLL